MIGNHAPVRPSGRGAQQKGKDRNMAKKYRSMDEKCNCKEPTSTYSEDGLVEWCTDCGRLITDHHLRKYGEPHPAR